MKVVQIDTGRSEIHLSCNIVNSRKTITFCRFLRIEDDMGFNIEGGMGNERYRLFGAIRFLPIVH